jgi:hypothetical protein
MATDNNSADRRDRVRRAWARGKLHIARDDVNDLRDAFWNVLVESQGTPPGEQRLAYRVLADSTVWTTDPSIAIPPVVVAAADVAAETQLSEAIEQFATQFFSLTPAERRERFAALNADVAAYPRLSRRLNEFATVLDAAPVKNATGHPRELELATWLEKLCVAPPSQRGALRCQAWKALYERAAENWPPAIVRQLKQRDPTAARCDSVLLEAIEQEPARALKRKEVQERRAVGRINVDQPKSYATSTASSEYSFPTWLIVLIAIISLRAFSSLAVPGRPMNFMSPSQYNSSPNSGNPYYSPQSYSSTKTPPMPDFPRRFDPNTGRDEIDVSKVGPAIRALLGHPPPTEAELQKMPPHLRSQYEDAARDKLEKRLRDLRQPDATP